MIIQGKTMKKITRITIQHIVDDQPLNDDWNHTAKPSNGCMIWSTGVFYDKIEQAKQIVSDLDDIIYDEDEKDNYIALCEKRRDNIQSWIDDNDREERNMYKYIEFPNMDVNDTGYKKYAENMYKRAQEYYNNYWHYIGIQVTAYSECTCCGIESEVNSHSLWGIESDCTEYHTEVETDLFNELKTEIENKGEYSMNDITIENCERLELCS